ncbi:hypothetical protein ml_138 [Mollivirus sibericum]|uniref:hypothetical protein n=1 Tax=Mollivirus sibericum TaxID=1678078 RepID=UPI0006B2DF94|nr:hypothetical protein ml_138 [Mollivirus sibericum]ALD61940.1 hypothetical protein ml_138 [Mollivirus sibericum]
MDQTKDMGSEHDNLDLPIVSLCDDALSRILCFSSKDGADYFLSVYDYKRLALTCRAMATRLLSPEGIKSLIGQRVDDIPSPKWLAVHAVAEEALAVSTVFAHAIATLTHTGQVLNITGDLVSCLRAVIDDRHHCEHDIAPFVTHKLGSEDEFGIMAALAVGRFVLAVQNGLFKTSAVFLRALQELASLDNAVYAYNGAYFNVSISEEVDQCLQSVMGFRLGQVLVDGQPLKLVNVKVGPRIDHTRAPEIVASPVHSERSLHMAYLTAASLHGDKEPLRSIVRAESHLAQQLAQAFWRSPLVSPTVVGLATNADPFDCCCRRVVHEPDDAGATMTKAICDDTRRRQQLCRRLFEVVVNPATDLRFGRASVDKVLIPWLLLNDVAPPTDGSRLVTRNVLIFSDIINRSLDARPAILRSHYDESGCFGTVEDLCDLVVDIQRLTDQCDQVHPWHHESQRLSICRWNIDADMTNYLIFTFVAQTTTRRQLERAVDRPSRRYWSTLLPSFGRAMTDEEESLAMLSTISIYIAFHGRIAHKVIVGLRGVLYLDPRWTTQDTTGGEHNALVSAMNACEIDTLFGSLLFVMLHGFRNFDPTRPEESTFESIKAIRGIIHHTVLETLLSKLPLSGRFISSDRLSPLLKAKAIALLLGIANIRPEAHDAAWFAQARAMYSRAVASSLV